MRDVFLLAEQTHINPAEPYLRAYPHLVAYFSGLEAIEPSDLVRGAHMAYAWMPTILKMHWENDSELHAAADTLSKARSGREISVNELNQVANLVNKSMVGASKLLHFAGPSRYPIWDSRVYRFVHEEPPYHYRLNDVDTYFEYAAKIHALAADPRMPKLLSTVESKLNYKVTPVRAIELIMFIHGAHGEA